MIRDFNGLCTIIYVIVLNYMYNYTNLSVYLYKSIRTLYLHLYKSVLTFIRDGYIPLYEYLYRCIRTNICI